jgi:(1->4)-alpha-D-glucan 1-alpha-D-glucosylmutase
LEDKNEKLSRQFLAQRTYKPAAAVVLQWGGPIAGPVVHSCHGEEVMKIRQTAQVRKFEQRRPVERNKRASVGRAYAIPFSAEARNIQEIYRELLADLPALGHRAEAGEAEFRRWLERFVNLGEQLGIAVPEAPPGETPVLSDADSFDGPEAIRELVAESFTRNRLPSATYRLQFNAGFTFRDARDLVPYLHALGISDCYASPVLQARAASSHGYDVCDHGRLNPELGGESGFDAFSDALRRRGMGLILDMVPNHMGIADAGNRWWMDVLENGAGSIYAHHFDIDWHPVNPDLENKVLLPLLEDQYGCVLEAGKIRLVFDSGAFFLCYYDIKLPVAPCSYVVILESVLTGAARMLDEEHEHLRELRSILTALRYLPPCTELPEDKRIERHREKEVVKRRLAVLYEASAEVRQALDAAVAGLNGTVGDPRGFDALDRLIDRQAYRPAYWRVAAEEINYRRFFDINELAAVRMETPEVFESAHRVLVSLLAEGKATGLRIDHPDGLRDPAGYFRQLQEAFVLAHVRAGLPAHLRDQSSEIRGQRSDVRSESIRLLTSDLRPLTSEGRRWPLYVVAEKILSEGEPLPSDWAVEGTTGYDFLSAVNGLFVNADGRDAFDRIYHSFTRTTTEFHQLVVSTKKMTMLVSMASEINALGHELDRIAERNRRYRDFTLNSLTFALREVIASLGVYRTYITGPDGVSPRDRQFLEAAVEEAKRRNPRTAEAVFDFVRDTLLLDNVRDFADSDRPRLVAWAMKCQQLTGPVMAKSVEDTVFYTYNRLLSLNEVGGSPDRFGVSPSEFHRRNAERLQRWPHSLLATATHDTKRGEDVRARLNVLSEMADEWESALDRWSHLNASKKTVVENQPAPDHNDEYLLYQTLLGAWPAEPMTSASLASFRDRVMGYLRKATKEAKVHTSWVNPNEEYDDAVQQFVARLLPASHDDPFLQDLQAFQRRLAFFGYFNSLAQVLLKLTCPGVPDFYQGSELWDLSLVDPDNRRPVDYRHRREMLRDLRRRIGAMGDDLRPLAADLLANLPDGRAKLYLIYRALHFRRVRQQLFAHGTYLPLEAAGPKCGHVCAFVRMLKDQAVLVAVPRLVVGLTGGSEQPPLGPVIWETTRLLLPPELAGRSYRNLFTGETLVPDHQDGTSSLSLAATLADFPVALLECRGARPGC